MGSRALFQGRIRNLEVYAKGESAGREDIHMFNHLCATQVFSPDILPRQSPPPSVVLESHWHKNSRKGRETIVMENGKGLNTLFGLPCSCIGIPVLMQANISICLVTCNFAPVGMERG